MAATKSLRAEAVSPTDRKVVRSSIVFQFATITWNVAAVPSVTAEPPTIVIAGTAGASPPVSDQPLSPSAFFAFTCTS